MSAPPHALKSEKTWPFFLDAIVLGGVIATVYLMVIVGRYWFGAIVPAAEISRSPRAIPMYTVYSLVRMTAATVSHADRRWPAGSMSKTLVVFPWL